MNIKIDKKAIVAPREVFCRRFIILAHVGFEVKVFVDKIAFMYRIFSP